MFVKGTPILVSEDAKASEAELLATAATQIKRGWKQHQGCIVVLPPADYVAAAATISYLLGDIGKPVVFVTMTGEESMMHKPGESEDVVLKSHIVSAVQVAISDIGAPILVQGSDMLHPLYTNTEHSPQGVRFTPIDSVTVGHVDFGVRPSSYALHRRKKAPQGRAVLSEHIPVIQLNADEELDTASSIPSKTEGLILVAPEQRTVRRAVEGLSLRFPVLLLTPKYVALYEQGRRIVLTSSRAAAVGKFRWLISTQRKEVAKHELARLMREKVPIEQFGVRV